MKRMALSIGLVSVVAMNCGCQAQERQELEMGPPRLASTRVVKAPKLDGNGDDEVWRSAIPLQMRCRRVMGKKRGSLPVTIRTVHTDTSIYFLVTWEDHTQSVTHKTWVLDADKKAYEQGNDREDMFSLAFEHTGTFDADMLAGIESVWDVWHWKAFRTNPQGYATDKTHRYTLQKPTGKARSFTARTGKKIWIARPEDAGTSVEKKRPAPATLGDERVAQYLPGAPTGSAADVRAKGLWADGRWTLELSRRLSTGHADDATLDPTRAYRIAMAVFDHTGKMDKASGDIVLSFAQAAVIHGFDADKTGAVPATFSKARTGRGAPGRWVVRQEDGAPSGRKVVAQTSDDQTSYRFPVLVHDEMTARDVDVLVRFKAITGRVDQAAGIVWRYSDQDNYYIVRANALEDNVVLYKVEKGRRSDLVVRGRKESYGVPVEVPAGRWNTLRVVAVGSLFQIYLNDQQLFEVEDSTFLKPGKVGLWTKADSVTHFDDLTVLRLDRPKEMDKHKRGK